MGLFGNRKIKRYPDAGTRLFAHLIRQFSLPGWSADLVPTYSEEELEAIQDGLGDFQRTADAQMGGGAQFHPEAATVIQRMITGEELIRYADDIWQFADEIPSDWRVAASAYLKAWASTLSPIALQQLGKRNSLLRDIPM